MITLLLVLFIVLFALSKIDEAKYKEFQESVSDDRVVNDSSVHGTTPHPSRGTRPVGRCTRATDQLRAIEKALSQALAQRGMLGDVTLSINSSGLVEGLVADSTFFQVDSAQLSPLGLHIVDASGQVLARYANNVDVAGYTDNQVITGGPTPTTGSSRRRAPRRWWNASRWSTPWRRSGWWRWPTANITRGAEHVARGAGTKPTGQHRRQAAAVEHGRGDHGHGDLVSRRRRSRATTSGAPRPSTGSTSTPSAWCSRASPARHDPALDGAPPALLTLAGLARPGHVGRSGPVPRQHAALPDVHAATGSGLERARAPHRRRAGHRRPRLAGSGEGDYPERILTEIEQELLSPVIGSVLDELKRALARLQPTEPRLEQHESNVQFLTIAAPGTPPCWRTSTSPSAAARRAS